MVICRHIKSYFFYVLFFVTVFPIQTEAILYEKKLVFLGAKDNHEKYFAKITSKSLEDTKGRMEQSKGASYSFGYIYVTGLYIIIKLLY